MIENPSSTESTSPMAAADVERAQSTERQFQRDSEGRLRYVDTEGQTHVGVTALRLFPLTAPDEWISLFNQDGQEVACIADLSQLAHDDRELLSDELKCREFVPEILRVRSTSGNTIPSEWEVDTDRGLTRFILKDEKDIRQLGPSQILILDAHGIRYLVHELQALDPVSRRIIERYI